jgi:hypothetical protein
MQNQKVQFVQLAFQTAAATFFCLEIRGKIPFLQMLKIVSWHEELVRSPKTED